MVTSLQSEEAGGIGTAGILFIVAGVCLVLLLGIVYFITCHKNTANQATVATRKPASKYEAADMQQESATATGGAAQTYDVQVSITPPEVSP